MSVLVHGSTLVKQYGGIEVEVTLDCKSSQSDGTGPYFSSPWVKVDTPLEEVHGVACIGKNCRGVCLFKDGESLYANYVSGIDVESVFQVPYLYTKYDGSDYQEYVVINYNSTTKKLNLYGVVRTSRSGYSDHTSVPMKERFIIF